MSPNRVAENALAELELTGFEAATLRHLVLEPEPELEDEIGGVKSEERVMLSLDMDRPVYEQIKPTVEEWIQTLGIRTHFKSR